MTGENSGAETPDSAIAGSQQDTHPEQADSTARAEANSTGGGEICGATGRISQNGKKIAAEVIEIQSKFNEDDSFETLDGSLCSPSEPGLSLSWATGYNIEN